MKKSNIVSSASEGSDSDDMSSSSNWTPHPPYSKKISNRRSKQNLRRETANRAISLKQRAKHNTCSTMQSKHYVEHNYHDHLHDPVLTPEEEAQWMVDNMGTTGPTTQCPKRRRSGHRGGVAVPFPEKLHFMLSQMEANGTEDIVNWQPHGRCFVVHKPQEFVDIIMPKFFRQSKMTSFQRQLNLYGFTRLTAGPDRGGYYHERLLRGRMDLCKQMVRTRIKGNGSKAAASPSTEPNFYRMQPCPTPEERTTTTTSTDTSNDSLIENKGKINELDNAGPLLIEDAGEEGVALFGNDDAEILLEPVPTYSIEQISADPQCATTPSQSSDARIVAPLVSPTVSRRISDVGQNFPSSGLHSGDELLFEGLPFHYLETRDVEQNLLLGIEYQNDRFQLAV